MKVPSNSQCLLELEELARERVPGWPRYGLVRCGLVIKRHLSSKAVKSDVKLVRLEEEEMKFNDKDKKRASHTPFQEHFLP